MQHWFGPLDAIFVGAGTPLISKRFCCPWQARTNQQDSSSS
jgi:hypothetical protein